MRELNDIFTQGMKMVIPEELTGSLRGKFSVFQQMDTMFKTANHKIDIVTTPEGMNELFANHLDALKKAKDRGVEIKIITNGTEKSTEAIKAFGSLGEVRVADEKEIPLEGRFAIVDNNQLVFSLTDLKSVHSTQDMAVWSKSEYAASSVLEPLFKLVWSHSKNVV